MSISPCTLPVPMAPTVHACAAQLLPSSSMVGDYGAVKKVSSIEAGGTHKACMRLLSVPLAPIEGHCLCHGQRRLR